MHVDPVQAPLPVPREEPLPLTLRVSLGIGAAITLGWFAMFALLQSRW